MHMAAARLRFGCKRTLVGTGCANSRPGCMSRLRKRYSHTPGGLFLVGKASWALSGCFPCYGIAQWGHWGGGGGGGSFIDFMKQAINVLVSSSYTVLKDQA